ncbi:MAG TPA: hypothetical protein VGR37_05535 [Longimicrobiaceae bacterium]|nr:hypothetical protein [Longimicrobiaceae bacterium]
MRRPSLLLLLLLPLLFGCRDESLLGPRGEPLGAISDAAHAGGLPGFYFLPPLVRATAYTGTFAATLAPRVEVCVVSGSECLPTSPATEFTRTAGLGGQVIVVDPVNQTYSVDWHTDLSNLDPTKAYRIRVWLGSIRLGFADVKVVSSGSELKNADTGEQIALKNGRTLPIKFRIETILASLIEHEGENFVRDCIASSSCVIKHVSPNSMDGSGKQVVKTPDGYFAGVFTDGFMDSYVAENPALYGSGVTVIIQQRATLPCFPGYSGAQAQGCARYETLPALERGFDVPQRVEECLDPNVQARDAFQLHKLSAIGPQAERGRVVALDPVTAGEINCDNFTSSPATLFQQAAAAVFRPLYRVFGPATAYASDIRYGGMTTSYSDIGYAQPATFSAVSGDGQTAAPGALLASPIRVRVLQGRDDASHSLVRMPVAGQKVTFIVASGGGTLATPTATFVAAVDSLDNFTNADGFVEVPWTLGPAAGPQTVVVKLPGIKVPELTFTATALSSVIDFETYPSGAQTCSNCPVTNEFSRRNVVFSFTPILDVAANYAQLGASTNNPQGALNHTVTAAGIPDQNGGYSGYYSGTVHMDFPSPPTTATFLLRVNNSVTTVPVLVQSPGAQVSRVTLGTYGPTGNVWREERITVTDQAGISRVSVGMNGYIALIDDLDLSGSVVIQ